jgi:sec-independent protein translocase protein TatB
VFDVAPTEFLLVAVVALVVIGPKDLPRVMRTVGQWVARARGVARHFRSGLDTMMREAELEEMEKKWKAENERIMREYPSQPANPEEARPEISAPIISGPDNAGLDGSGAAKPAHGDDSPPNPRPLP